MRSFRRRLLGVVLLSAALVAIGTVGYMQFPGWSIGDAMYMTVITLTAVGYEEVQPVAGGARVLTAFLLVGGITTMGLYFGLIASTIVEMDLPDLFRFRRTMKGLEEIEDHIIVCGAGRTGRQAVSELHRAREAHPPGRRPHRPGAAGAGGRPPGAGGELAGGRGALRVLSGSRTRPARPPAPPR